MSTILLNILIHLYSFEKKFVLSMMSETKFSTAICDGKQHTLSRARKRIFSLSSVRHVTSRYHDLMSLNILYHLYLALIRSVSSLRSTSSLMKMSISAEPETEAGANLRLMLVVAPGPMSSLFSTKRTRSGRLEKT